MRILIRSAAAVLAAVFLFVTGAAYASSGKTIEVSFLPGVKFVLNGKALQAGDSQGMFGSGRKSYPNHVVYKDNLYLPAGLVEQATGAKITWNRDKKTISITSKLQLLDFALTDLNRAPSEIKSWVDRSKKIEIAQVKNLNGKTYLLVTRGEKTTGGYGVSITRVEDLGNELLVSVRYTDPSGMVTQALSYPFVLAEIPRTEKPVRFTGENGRVISQLPRSEELSPIIKGSANIKYFGVSWEKSRVTVKGILKTPGNFEYVVKDQKGRLIDSGILSNGGSEGLWFPYTITIPRAGYGGSDSLYIRITRTHAGARESLDLNIHHS